MNKIKLRTPNRKYICKLFDFGCSARLDEDAAGQNIGVCLCYKINYLIQLFSVVGYNSLHGSRDVRKKRNFAIC